MKSLKSLSINFLLPLLSCAFVFGYAFFLRASTPGAVSFIQDTVLQPQGTISGDLLIASGSECSAIDINNKTVTVSSIPAGASFTLKTTAHSPALSISASTAPVTLSFSSDDLISGRIASFALSASDPSARASIVWNAPLSSASYDLKANGIAFRTVSSTAGGEISFSYGESFTSSRTFTLANSQGGAVFIPALKPDVSQVEIMETETGTQLKNVPDNITEIAISCTPNFTDISWQTFDPEKIKTIGDITEIFYVKFRTDKGAVSDVVVCEPKTVALEAIKDGDIIQCKNSSNPFAVYIVKIAGGRRYIRHLVSLEIFNYYQHLRWEDLKQVDSLDGYSLSGWIRLNSGPEGTPLSPDRIWEVNGDQTRHWIDMTAEEFLLHGGSEDAIYSINSGELELYEIGAVVKLI